MQLLAFDLLELDGEACGLAAGPAGAPENRFGQVAAALRGGIQIGKQP